MAFLILLLIFSSAFGERAYVTDCRDQVMVLDSETGSLLQSISLPGRMTTEIVVSPDGATLYVISDPDSTLLFVDAHSGKVLLDRAVGYGPVSMALSPDGARLYVLSQVESTVHVIDTLTGEKLSIIPVGEYPNVVVIDPSGTFAYVSSNGRSGSGVITLIDMATYQTSTLFQTAYFRPRGLAVSPDGALLYVADAFKDIPSSSGAIYILNTSTQNSLKVLIPELTTTTQLALSKDGSNLYISEFDNAEYVMDLGAKVVRRISGADGGKRFALSLDGHSLFSTDFSAEGRIYVVDTATSELTTTFNLPNSSYGIAVAPNPPEKPSPPSALSGSSRIDRFINFSTSLKTLTWTASSSLNVSGYRVYRAGVLLAALPAGQLSYSFKEKSKAKVTYEVSAVDTVGRESDRIQISL